MLKAVCKECHQPFERTARLQGKMDYCSRSCMAAARGRAMRGAAHPKWNGGSADRAHPTRKCIRNLISERGKCEECSATADLQGHHRESHSVAPALRADPANIQVLCRACHAEKHPKLKAFILAGRIHA
jgi:5-methylcytosine-specific restriction endonuclease McrA